MLYAANEDLGNAFDYQSVDTNNDPSEVQLPSQGHSRGHSRHGSVSSTHSATENLYNTFASFSTAGSTSGHHAEHHGQPSKKGGATSANHKHGSLLMHTAAAADGEIHFNNSLKSKPVHATGHHMTDGEYLQLLSVCVLCVSSLFALSVRGPNINQCSVCFSPQIQP